MVEVDTPMNKVEKIIEDIRKERCEYIKQHPEYAERYKLIRDNILYGAAYFEVDKNNNLKHVPYYEAQKRKKRIGNNS